MRIDWWEFYHDLVVYGQATVNLKAGGVNWWYPEEEKRVKQIDFSKPVVSPTSGRNSKVKVLQEGVTLVEITGSFGADGVYAIDEYGKVQSWQSPNHKNFGQGVKFENKPEEPKDHLQLWWYDYKGTWELDHGLRTKSEAEAWAKEPTHNQRRQAVKVPV